MLRVGPCFFMVLLNFGLLQNKLWSQSWSNAESNPTPCKKLDLFIHTDRDVYFAPDTLWLQASILNRNNKKIANQSIELFLELINESGEVKITNRYKVEGGRVNDKIALGKLLGTGVFNLVIYTKSCSEPGTFHTCQLPILIGSSQESTDLLLKKKGLLFTPVAKSKKGLSIDYGQNSQSLFKSGMATVPLKATARELPIALTGNILNEKGDSVGNFETNQLGLGETSPVAKNKLFKLVVDSGFTPAEFPLFIPHNSHYDLEINHFANHHQIKSFSLDSIPKKERLLLILEDVNGHKTVNQIALQNGMFTNNFASEEFAEGLVKVALFSVDGMPHTTKFFYNYWPELDILVSKDSFLLYPEENVSLDVSIKDPLGKPIEASLLVLLKRSNNFTHSYRFPYLSRLSNPQENFLPVFFPRTIDGKQELAMALNFYNGKYALENNSISEHPLAAFNSDSINFYGQAKGLEDRMLIAYCFDGNEWVRVVKSDEKGRFYFAIPAYYGQKKITILNSGLLFDKEQLSADSDVTIDLVTHLRPQLEFLPFLVTDSTTMFKALQKRIEANVLGGYFKEEPLVVSQDSIYQRPTIYDGRFVLEEYNKMPNMYEVLREFVKGVAVRKAKEGYKLRVFSLDRKENFNNEPVFFIDDQIVFDKDLILSLNLSQVHSVDVINSFKNLSRYGVLGKNGILRINTKSGVFPVPVNNQIATFYLNGFKNLNNQVNWHAQGNTTNFNLDPNIYWNPSIQTDGNGKASIQFKLTHEINQFELIVRALTKNGYAGEKRIPLKVQSPEMK